ncbi:MAG: M48 family metalloprotease [Candidatus Omnitrophica bacterium]|nr:M48 family metalloprotease [Candidatus Omnitrophota bacterium]
MSYIKTGLLLVVMTFILMWVGSLVAGPRGVIIAFIVAMVLNGVSYWYSDKIVLKMYNARPLSSRENADIYSVVEELSSRADIPAPRVYITDVAVPNAFATGRDPDNAALCLTRGLVELLDKEELKGVISHELSHIKHRDTLIMTVTAAMASAIMMAVYMARWAAILGGFSRERNDSGNIIGLLAVSIFAPIAALIVQLAISRSREYAADTRGAEIAGSPEGLARALEQMARGNERTRFDAAPQTQHLFIVKPSANNFVANLFSTHPPVAERVKRLRSMA